MIDALKGTVGLIFLILKWTWPVLVLVFIFLIWQNSRKKRWVENSTGHTLLTVQVPRGNTKKELAAEQMFAAIHGILRPKTERIKEGSLQEHISFEIVSVDQHIRFYVWVPNHIRDFVEGQIYAQYPDVEINEVEDYTDVVGRGMHISGTELKLTKPEVFPIKTFQNFEVDPLAGITAVLAKLEAQHEQVWIQILARPVEDEWQNKGLSYIEQVKTGRTPLMSGNIALNILDWLIDSAALMVRRLFIAPGDEKPGNKPEVSSSQSTINSAVEEKATKLGYEVKIRIAYIAGSDELTRQRLQAVVGAFKQFNTTNLNGFAPKGHYSEEEMFEEYKARYFADTGFILNIEELASLYHLPHESVETPNIEWATYRKSEPPSNLPIEGMVPDEELTLFAKTNFRNRNIRFGLKREDRLRHVYVIGKTGMGKSYMMEGMAISDIFRSEGVAFVDPHGDAIDKILSFIPEDRINDVILIDPSDSEHPVGFNPLEVPSAEFRNLIASNLVGVLKRIWADSWGPRMEYILRLTLLALLETEDPTMLGVTRMLTDKTYRKQVISQVQDPVVKHFWVNEFSSYSEKFANEAVAPILNKVGQFLSSTVVRNIIGQQHSTFDFRSAMDEGKIILINLATGKIGEDNAALLGAMMITKIQLAAMSRANVPEEQRRDFYLYVDEFQNFATDSFAVILSEARKYHLALTMANQYIAQMPETVKNAVFGNVGTMITFRVGAGDASLMEKEFAPSFEASDLVNLPAINIYIKESIDGITSVPFSAQTLTLSENVEGHQEEIRKQSQAKYGRDRAQVEDSINKWTGLDMDMIDDRIRVQDRAEEQRAQAIADNQAAARADRRPRSGERSRAPRSNESRPSSRSSESRPPSRATESRPSSRAGEARPVIRPQTQTKKVETASPKRVSHNELAEAIKSASATSTATQPISQTNTELAPAPARNPEPAPAQPEVLTGNVEAQRQPSPQEIKPGETIRFE